MHKRALYLEITLVLQAKWVLAPPFFKARVEMMPTKSSSKYSQNPLGLPREKAWY
jgi:hypothetical protein